MALIKNVFLVLLLLLLFALAAEAQSQCTRYSDAADGFSICSPEGWVRSNDPGQKFSDFNAPPPNVRNLNFKDEDSKLPLDAYTTKAIENMLGQVKEMGFDSLTMVSRSDFETASKAKGVRLILTGSFKGVSLRTTQFIFERTDLRKILMTFTGLDSYKDENNRGFDAVAATFQLEK
jgi:uroporphyrinogen-III decarboxylase